MIEGRRPFILLAMCIMLAGAAASCSPFRLTAPSPTPAASVMTPVGVGGHVLAGPTCPVERAGASPCVRPVAGATILARAVGGTFSRWDISSQSGDYFIHLPPGRYSIEPQPVAGLTAPAPIEVVVTRSPPVSLDLRYDTGIR